MKKCPFCKAEIEDNARFCLYCMKPLNNKEVIQPLQKKTQWWPLAVAGILLLALLALLLFIPRGQIASPQESTGGETSLSTQSTDTQPPESTSEEVQPPQGQTPSHEGEQQTPIQATPEPSESANPVSPTTQTTQPTQTTTPPTDPENPPQIPTPTEPEETTETPTETTPEPEVPAVTVAYTYRAARAGDDFNANYTNSGNDIVITGISQQSANGIYDIPSYIDGKKVIAIVANAFSGSNARIVYVPTTVKTIWNYAFAGCGLTDIYFRGNSIYVESKAFSGGLTIHCSASCSDRNFRYYKDCAASYGATWEEWNG